MTKLKIAMVQFNPVVGDLDTNIDRMYDLYVQHPDVDLVVFPEMAVTGYPLEDLVLYNNFVSCAIEAGRVLLERIRNNGHTVPIIYGNIIEIENLLYNGAYYYLPETNTLRMAGKQYLPNYGVFDEKRVFQSSLLRSTFDLKGLKIVILICEDMWQAQYIDADLIIGINGSPYEIGKQEKRYKVVDSLRGICDTVLYVNMVGGQDELVFDGSSFVNHKGFITQFPSFTEGVYIADIDIEREVATTMDRVDYADCQERTDTDKIYNACVLGLREYLGKQSFKSVVLGMSGGVDSGIVAAIAADAIGAENVNLVRLPSKYSSQHSLDDAQAAAEVLGSPIRTINIEAAVEALRALYGTSGVTDENIQARTRGNILMAISNQEGHILLSTGNKSEVSVGYCTLYGDMSGGFNPIKDCYKTTVWELCRFRNTLSQEDIEKYGYLGSQGEVVPENIINKPPSAELREGQEDSQSLPSYDILDAILISMIEKVESNHDIVIKGYDEKLVLKVRGLLNGSEYKRRQSSPGIKITSMHHNKDRRYPIVNSFSEGVEANFVLTKSNVS